MRIGLFSDVHGNAHAFEKVLERLRAAALDQYIFCGALCGYYYDQNAVVDMLESLNNLVGVRGNHDQLFLESLEDERKLASYTETYGGSLRDLRGKVTPKTLSFLRGLADRYVDPDLGLAVFHGSPWDVQDEYVYPTDPVDRFAELPYRYVVLGHTHYAMLRRANRVLVINPGSCGQPRDSGPPSYAVLDTDTGAVDVERVPYDPKPLIARVRRRTERNAYLTQALER